MNIFLIDTVNGQMALADIHSDTGWLRGICLSRCQMPECGVVLDHGRHFAREMCHRFPRRRQWELRDKRDAMGKAGRWR